MKKVVLLTLLSLVVFACAKPTQKDVVQVIETDNLIRFKNLRKEIGIDTLRFEAGGTIFHQAYQLRATKIMNQLIDEEILLNESDSLGYTPLLALVQDVNPNEELIYKLLTKDVNVNTVENYNGFSALHYAVHNKQSNLVKKLLIKQADPNSVSKSLMQSTPLHIAVENKDIENIENLISITSDTIKDYNGKTVVDLAIRSNDIEIQKMFYKKMSIEDKQKLFISTARSSNDIAFLEQLLEEKWITKEILNQSLVFAKDTVITEKLLKKGAKINYLHSKYKYGAIHYAAVRGNVPMLEFLLKKGANINQLSKNNTMSVLMHAAQLYENFNDIDKKGAKLGIGLTQSALDFFANSKEKTKENSLATVKFLIAKKANLNFKDRYNANVLYYAEASQNSLVATYLREIGVKETKKFTESKTSRFSRLLNRS
ncbi:ankyrin repeat domain-containing protein [uncultured Tenacibaculum sp.]|uniref:ankyrin repeat domain-containing protein n=1 Tax=uncultured Tenacibaculum sp. TaxID=174713 RepID=UPI0026094195|nr:ankyrin repeat domain-containing protein [uncultured Tenacibaculum sp.]